MDFFGEATGLEAGGRDPKSAQGWVPKIGGLGFISLRAIRIVAYWGRYRGTLLLGNHPLAR